ncbi:peroxiredoxin family protein [Flavobacterium collinsii]|uniref:Thiol-disulfide oxidoreductase ResA n=1 Tax=Flavobacterium collinsii TaxID=1114861 RepID=A0ABN7EJM7_9FLAO|nr:redoxin domain-containing protein [Flavobacterium collinsii]CAA9198802.1 Thiol-disulfide oxidoreductase ResA [Flavobacterium collinsii]
MKKKLKIILTISFICILAFFTYQIVIKINHKKEAAENIKTIPEFSYKNINGGFFTNRDIKINTPTLFIYFNSECEYCNEEAKMIKENAEKFQNVQLIFVSFEKLELIKTFVTKHQLTSYDNIHFLCDNKVTFSATFDVKSLPCLVLYNKNQKLVEKIKGQTKTEILLKKLTSE